jgi:hypothetical protein
MNHDYKELAKKKAVHGKELAPNYTLGRTRANQNRDKFQITKNPT